MKHISQKTLALFILPAMLLSACSGSPLSVTLSRSAAQSGAASSANTTAAATTNQTAAMVQPVVAKQAPITQATQASTGDLTSYQEALETVYKTVNPSVVSIQVTSRSLPPPTSGAADSRTRPRPPAWP